MANRSEQNRWRAGVVRVVVIALASCCACDQVVMREPATRDLVGTYRLTDESRRFLRGTKKYASLPEGSIEIGPESVIHVRELPDCAIDPFGHTGGSFVSGQGEWQLKKESLGYSLDLKIADGGSIPRGFYVGWVTLRGGPPHYELEIIVGDPDSGERLRYARQAS